MSSYVEGTVIRSRARYKVTDTGEAYEPAEVTFRAARDGGGVAIERSLTAGGVVAEGVSGGWGTFRCDWTPDAPGTWWYQFATSGSNAVVKKDKVVVRSAT